MTAHRLIKNKAPAKRVQAKMRKRQKPVAKALEEDEEAIQDFVRDRTQNKLYSTLCKNMQVPPLHISFNNFDTAYCLLRQCCWLTIQEYKICKTHGSVHSCGVSCKKVIIALDIIDESRTVVSETYPLACCKVDGFQTMETDRPLTVGFTPKAVVNAKETMGQLKLRERYEILRTLLVKLVPVVKTFYYTLGGFLFRLKYKTFCAVRNNKLFKKREGRKIGLYKTKNTRRDKSLTTVDYKTNPEDESKTETLKQLINNTLGRTVSLLFESKILSKREALCVLASDNLTNAFGLVLCCSVFKFEPFGEYEPHMLNSLLGKERNAKFTKFQDHVMSYFGVNKYFNPIEKYMYYYDIAHLLV
ncbi:ORF44-like protein [Bufonid herpesvirus 1]|uniref:ORF44-like protein n=1 Tax=Bufonid herpesvirus 1 TaxID=2282206 RepID=UPI000EB6AE6F|nr:ORF44-like protein [Bufonid herpesvirus 1]AXF48605.1 ORF44-like protein [Bufonid herpesvirus 1]